MSERKTSQTEQKKAQIIAYNLGIDNLVLFCLIYHSSTESFEEHLNTSIYLYSASLKGSCTVPFQGYDFIKLHVNSY